MHGCGRSLAQRALVLAVLLAVVSGAGAHEHGAEAGTAGVAELGTVSFATSCRPAVQADFNRGIALLHSFWHEEARRTFDQVVSADPDCASAYWGQAMASFHLYSSTPSPADLAAVGVALTKAAAASETSPREAGYVTAMHALYDGFEVSKYADFAGRFAEAMRGLAARYPDDVDATAFYALALLTSIPPGDTTLTIPRKAMAVMAPAFRKHADHPGLVHYIIHATDHPQMARQGLDAARRYAAVAPAAPHALHMPSHIFARLGLWEEDISSNLASLAASEDTSRGPIGAENRLHAMEFLQYAYLQTGQFEEAQAIATRARTVKKEDTIYGDYYLTVQARFGLLLAVETQDWTMAANLAPVPGAHWYSEAHTLLAHAMAAGHLRDAEAGAKAVKSLDELLASAKVDAPPGLGGAHLRDEIYAWASLAQGDAARALQLLGPIADRQAQVGKGEVELPAREMLADVLLLEHRPADALREYQRSLEIDPNRFNGLLGAARAAEQAGRGSIAARLLRQLTENCPGASGAAREILKDAAS
jgi:tetratricopeptide (TPR) repeat protein